MKKISIIDRYIPQYRLRFYELLRTHLELENIQLNLIYGSPGIYDALKKDDVQLKWGIPIQNKTICLMGKELYWQPVFKHIRNSDLVIIDHASRLLVNYILVLENIIAIRKVAFWGHGKNFQQDSSNPLSELIKQRLTTKVTWWFVYNGLSERIVKRQGFPEDRITNVQNAIDTRQLHEEYCKIIPSEVEKKKTELGISGNHIGLFVGAMYPEKRLGFLLETCRFIKQNIPDFEMLFIGSGIDVDLVKSAAETDHWIHYLPPKFRKELIPYFAISTIFLMPGAVGLAVLDCFAMTTPLVTTDNSNHGPEIDYLVNGVNGIMVKDNGNPKIYADEIINILNNDEMRENLKRGCEESCKKYTIEEMVNRFVDGVKAAIS